MAVIKTSMPPLAYRAMTAQLGLDAIMKNAPIGILFTRQSLLVQANEQCAAIFGYTVEELVGRKAVMLYPSEVDYELLGKQAGRLLAAGELFQTDYEMQRKDGRRVWCRLRGRALNPQRVVDGTLWTIEDISEERLINQSLENRTHELTAIFESQAMGVAIIRESRIVRSNQRWEDIRSMVAAFSIDQSKELFFPDDETYERLQQFAWTKFQLGQIFSTEQKYLHDDGRPPLWLRMVGTAFDATHPEAGAVWMLEDITDRRLAEETLRDAHDVLESRVLERTRELESVVIQLQQEISERIRAERNVWEIAHHDSLTGLPNRVLLHDRLEQVLASGQRNRHQAAVMFLDLDRFKKINDTLGHAIGDELLKHVAQRLTGIVRAVDTVSRIGGDEFVILLHEISSVGDALLVAEKILAVLEPVIMIEGHALQATPSIGISIYPDDASDAVLLMKNADAAMYHAKDAGRNTFRLYSSKMDEQASRFFAIEQRLQQAIKVGQMVLHYQPLIDWSSHTVCGMEALVRWNDPVHGVIMPSDFIPIAEETGLIVPLGEWVLVEALRQNCLWQEAGRPAMPISINLSPRQFRQPRLADTVRRILLETGQPASFLELEITESSLMHDAVETIAILDELAALGVRITVDDFGTGYSSLSYLKRFQVHKLKIDQSFVRDVTADRDDVAIVTAVVGLAKSMGLDTIAEGVERLDQLNVLIGLGCHKFQGYFFSCPLPAQAADSIFGPAMPKGMQQQIFF
ncbi:MAG: EAL domain-containing protein [Rugosibacter sp.]|nr:MAG: EAL domain-containing protein [Rugosibacter sp.]